MTTDPTYAALRAYDRCVTGLMADPEVTRDLLLIGMWLARATHLRDPEPSETGWHLADMASALFPMRTGVAMFVMDKWIQGQETAPDAWHVFEVLKKDIRRYDPMADHPGPRQARTPCGGPMVRRDRCGKPSVIYSFAIDPATGRKQRVGACRKHETWYWAQRQANREACAAVEVPRPAANAGGLLAAHITSLDWPALWAGLDPNWVPPPEVDSWERPALRLLVSPEMTSGRPPSATPPPPRPRFALINGAKP